MVSLFFEQLPDLIRLKIRILLGILDLRFLSEIVLALIHVLGLKYGVIRIVLAINSCILTFPSQFPHAASISIRVCLFLVEIKQTKSGAPTGVDDQR